MARQTLEIDLDFWSKAGAFVVVMYVFYRLCCPSKAKKSRRSIAAANQVRLANRRTFEMKRRAAEAEQRLRAILHHKKGSPGGSPGGSAPTTPGARGGAEHHLADDVESDDAAAVGDSDYDDDDDDDMDIDDDVYGDDPDGYRCAWLLPKPLCALLFVRPCGRGWMGSMASFVCRTFTCALYALIGILLMASLGSVIRMYMDVDTLNGNGTLKSFADMYRERLASVHQQVRINPVADVFQSAYEHAQRAKSDL